MNNIKSNFWKNYINEQSKEEYFKNILKFLEDNKDKKIYPKEENIFKVFDLDIEDIKVVLIGQDPYHQPGQANGLSFSVSKDQKVPPSLKNMFKEIKRSLNIEVQEHGDLTEWFNQGVFLLNTILTVEDSKPLSHKKIGWEIFTSNVINEILKRKEKVIFLCLGNNAKNIFKGIETHHYIIETSHPSPLGVYRGFDGSNIFKKINEILIKENKKQIEWGIK